MSLLDSIVGRVTAAAAKAPPLLMLAHNKDWNAMLSDIDAKHADADARRNALVSERDAQVIASVAGQPGASAKADALDKQVDAVDRELARLGTARANAMHHLNLEETGKAAAAAAAQDRRVKKQARDVKLAADAADTALVAFSEAMRTLDKAMTELRTSAGPEAVYHCYDFWAHAPLVIDAALAGLGPFCKSPLLSADKLTFTGNAERNFEGEYMTAMARRSKQV